MNLGSCNNRAKSCPHITIAFRGRRAQSGTGHLMNRKTQRQKEQLTCISPRIRRAGTWLNPSLHFSNHILLCFMYFSYTGLVLLRTTNSAIDKTHFDLHIVCGRDRRAADQQQHRQLHFEPCRLRPHQPVPSNQQPEVRPQVGLRGMQRAGEARPGHITTLGLSR